MFLFGATSNFMRHRQSMLLAIAITVLLGCGPAPTELRLITPKSPIDQEIAIDLADLLGRESGVNVTLVPAPEDDETVLESLASGDGDIAIITNNMPFRPDIATIMPLYPTILHIAYRKGRPTGNSRELIAGARVFAGLPGTPSRLLFKQIADRYGLTEKDFSFVESFDQSTDLVIVFAPISPDRMPELPDYKLFSLGKPSDIGTGSTVDAATLLNPQFKPFVIPVGTYGELTPEPVLTLAVDRLLVARRDLDATVVYDLVGGLISLRPALSSLRPGLFQSISGDFDPSSSTFIIHPGAQAYAQRNAPTVYERYSGIAEVAVTVLIALSSAIFAALKIYRMRRKNRIDTFYSAVIAIKKSIDKTTTEKERQEKADEIRSLQLTAFELLIDEKLTADESFRIFVTLSNDILRQLGALTGQDSVSDT
jgi:TRAP-type uncharacterized transport system substrate-binding protein